MEKRILIVYATKEGQTAKIAEYLGEQFRAGGYETHISNIKEIPKHFSFEGFNGIVIGSSVHMGNYSAATSHFIRQYKTEIEKRPASFFSVSLSDASIVPEERAELDPYVAKFLNKAGWTPEKIGRFGGALAYTKYGWFTRFIMQRIGSAKGAPSDTSKDWELTDWELVKNFGTEFLDRIEAPEARVSS
jgi:menaquinone-dependent protoporphyrinogen oxidase